MLVCILYINKCKSNTNKRDREDMGILLKVPEDPNTNEHETGDWRAILDKPTQPEIPTYQDPSTIWRHQAPTGDIYTLPAKKPVYSSKVNKQGEVSVIIVVAHLSDPNLNNIVVFTANYVIPYISQGPATVALKYPYSMNIIIV